MANYKEFGKRGMMKIKLVLIAVSVFVTAASTNSAWAAHGTQHTGFGPIQEAMSGAGAAAPLDAHTIIMNPAGMTKVTDRVDFAVGFGVPLIKMDTSLAPAGNPAAGNQSADTELFPLPFISTIWGFMDDRLAFGLSFMQDGGAAASYKQSRTNPLLTGNLFDTMIDYRIYKALAGVAYEIMDGLSIGATFQMGYGTLSTDFIDTRTLTQNTGRGRSDSAFGFGGSFGILYQPIPEFSFGVNYTSKTWFMKFGKYNDFLRNRSIDTPHQLQAGVAGRPFPWWLICLDFHWLNWSGVTALGESPVNGGLGWDDQYIAAIGMQFDVWDRLHLRVGYDWQTSVVKSDAVYVNALVPLITEMNINGGFGVDISDNWAVDIGVGYALKNNKTQAGGDAVSQSGTGTRSQYQGIVVVAGASYKWGKKE